MDGILRAVKMCTYDLICFINYAHIILMEFASFQFTVDQWMTHGSMPNKWCFLSYVTNWKRQTMVSSSALTSEVPSMSGKDMITTSC